MYILTKLTIICLVQTDLPLPVVPTIKVLGSFTKLILITPSKSSPIGIIIPFLSSSGILYSIVLGSVFSKTCIIQCLPSIVKSVLKPKTASIPSLYFNKLSIPYPGGIEKVYFIPFTFSSLFISLGFILLSST